MSKKENIIDKVLHTTGYLPPRNEDEMKEFEKICSKVKVNKKFKVDVNKIVNKK